jgi:hypothetical protein
MLTTIVRTNSRMAPYLFGTLAAAERMREVLDYHHGLPNADDHANQLYRWAGFPPDDDAEPESEDSVGSMVIA